MNQMREYSFTNTTASTVRAAMRSQRRRLDGFAVVTKLHFRDGLAVL